MKPLSLPTDCAHCWHPYHGPLWMVLASGQVVQECCHCGKRRTIHQEHLKDARAWNGDHS